MEVIWNMVASQVQELHAAPWLAAFQIGLKSAS
jgi:hypothetical protein